MKRILLLAFILTGTTFALFPQDQIITRNNDTIECRITRVTRNEILFEIDTKGVTSSGKLPFTEIASYSVTNPPTGGSSPASPPGAMRPASPTGSIRPVIADTGPLSRLRLSLNGGAGYIFSSSEKAEEVMVAWGIAQDNAEAYYNDLKLGIYGSGDITFMVTPRIGTGLRYKFFCTDAGVKGSFDSDDGMYLIYGTYSEHIYGNFAGVSLFYTESVGRSRKLSLYASWAAGLTLYRNETETFQGNFLITGKSLGMDGTLGLEYRLTPSMALGAELSAFNSLLRKIEMTDGTNTETLELEKENIENLSRFELSLGIRFYLWNR
jgi:hypothetical protein